MRRHSPASALLLGALALSAAPAFAAPRTSLPPVIGHDADGDAKPTDYVPAWEPPFLATDALVPANINVSNRTAPQSETSIAVDPTNANHILASSNDLGTTAGVFESFDGGVTWTRSTFGSSGFCYDTWVDFNLAGDAFIAYECSNQSIAYKNAGSSVWSAINGISGAGSFPDRSMCTVDKTGLGFTGSVYIAYDDASANNAAYVLYSRTGKGGWTRSPKINGSGSTIGVNACVGPDGTVYAFWEDFPNRKLWVDKSVNGGVSWSTDVLVHNYRMDTTPFSISIPPQNQRGVAPMPYSATALSGPFTGRVYVTYLDTKSGLTGETGIYLRYSDTSGATFSAEKNLLAASSYPVTYCFQPQIAVMNDGTVCVSFYVSGGAASKKTRQVAVFSHDGGDTWTDLQLVADTNSDETAAGHDGNQYGDYQGVAAAPTGFWVTWTDSRLLSSRGEEQFAAFMLPVAKPAVAKKGAARGVVTSSSSSSERAPYDVSVQRTSGALGFAHVNFTLPEPGDVSLRVVDASGREVAELMHRYAFAGEYSVPFTGRDARGASLPNGVYLYTFAANGHASSGRIVIAR